MTAEQIYELPAAWYSSQDVPAKLVRHLSEPPDFGNWRESRSSTRSLRKAFPKPKKDLSAVERAHRRSTNMLLRRTQP